MTLTVTWGTGSSARTWSLRLPDTATLVESMPTMARVSLPNPATVKRALGIAEPFLTLGAEAAGAGVPELLLVVAAVAAAKRMLSQARPADPKPAPTSPPVPGTPSCAA
jgi:Ca2+/Na+ antiporter